MQRILRGITKPIRPSINEAFRIQPLYWPRQLIWDMPFHKAFAESMPGSAMNGRIAVVLDERGIIINAVSTHSNRPTSKASQYHNE